MASRAIAVGACVCAFYGVTAQTLYHVAYTDVVVIGRVSSEPSVTVRVPTLQKPEGPVTGQAKLGQYEFEVQQTIKGQASGKIKVVGYQGDITGRGGETGESGTDLREWARNERAGIPIPRGSRIILLLQEADASGAARYMRHPNSDGSVGDEDYIRLPDRVRNALTSFIFQEPPYRYMIPDSAPQTFPLKHDYPGRDMMRVWVRATEGLPVDEQKGLVEDLGLVRVSLWPTAANFNYDWTGFRTDYDRRIADQFGPNPLKFYREEIAPNLPPIGPKTTELQIILRHVIAGSYGDPDAAKEIAAAVFALDTSKSPKLRERVAEIVGGLGLLPNGNEAAVSLYTHRDALIVQKALMNPFPPGEGKKYAKQVVALLDHEWEGVRLEALRMLSMIYGEPDKDWDMDKIGTRSYPSEALIQYWKEKVGK
ncbi:MAG: hypothetical protein AMXMBFR61_10370 [Fimbriimonadales bacterium]